MIRLRSPGNSTHSNRLHRWSTLLLGVAPLWLLQACSDLKPVNLLNAAIPQVGYTLSSNVPYGADERQRMDIYHPDELADDHRLIVFVYGGAWRKGNKSEFEFVGQALSSAGHTVVIPDYRLYPNVTFPLFVTDIAAAVTSLPSTPQLSAVDTHSIVLMGHSSGAHTAALISADTDYLANSGVTIEALIGMAGPYDLPLNNPEVTPVFAGASADRLKPVDLVQPSHPPTLLMHGLADRRVDPRHTRRFTEALQAQDIPVTTILVDGGSHAGLIAGVAAPFQFTNDTLQQVLDFLSQLQSS